MRLSFLLLSLLLLTSLQLSAQGLDYLKLFEKDTLLSVCRAEDSSSVSALAARLESLPPDSITRNRHLYHYELGMTYYKLRVYRKDTSYMRKAAGQMLIALKYDPYYSPALWNAALMHMFMNECTPARHYIILYKKLCPRKEYDKSGLKWINKRCKT